MRIRALPNEALRPRRAMCALFSGLALLPFSPASAPAGVPDWVDGIAVSQGLEAFPDDDLVELLRAYQVTVREAGERRVVFRRVYHLRRGDDGRLRAFTFRESPDQRLIRMKAWVRDPQGRVETFGELLRSQAFSGELYSEEVDVVLALGAVVPGSVAAVELEFDDRMKGLPVHLVDAHEGLSLVEGRYDLLAGADRSADAVRFVANEPEPVPLSADTPSGGRWGWRWGPLQIVRIEDPPRFLAPQARSAVAVRLGGLPSDAGWMESWRSIAAWFDGLCAEALAEPGGTPALASTLRARAGGSDRRFMEAVAEQVRASCRYVQIYLKDGGWRPHPVAEIERNGYGDCKDMAVETVALLRSGGLRAYPALTTATFNPVRPNLPTPTAFDHAIVAIESPGAAEPFLFFDPTAKSVPFGWLPWQLEGAWTLVVGCGTDSALVRLPASATDRNREVYDARIAVTADLAASGSVSETYVGQPAFEMRAALSPMTEKERIRRWQQRLDRLAPGAAVASLEIPKLGAVEETLRVHYQIRVPSIGRKVGGRAYVRPDLLTARPSRYFPESDRDRDIAFRYGFTTATEIRLMLPPGARVEAAAAALVENSFGRYAREIEPIPGGVLIRRSESVRGARMSAELYPEARRWDAVADSADHARIEIVMP